VFNRVEVNNNINHGIYVNGANNAGTNTVNVTVSKSVAAGIGGVGFYRAKRRPVLWFLIPVDQGSVINRASRHRLPDRPCPKGATNGQRSRDGLTYEVCFIDQ
jgi:hypothetical protein